MKTASCLLAASLVCVAVSFGAAAGLPAHSPIDALAGGPTKEKREEQWDESRERNENGERECPGTARQERRSQMKR